MNIESGSVFLNVCYIMHRFYSNFLGLALLFYPCSVFIYFYCHHLRYSISVMLKRRMAKFN